MKKYCEIKLFKNAQSIEVEYRENKLKKTENTGIKLYDKYKISILLSDGMLVIHDSIATRTEKGDFLIFRPDELHSARILEGGVYKYLDIFVPLDFFENFDLDVSEINEFLEHRGGENCIRLPDDKKEALLLAVKPIIKGLREETFGGISDFSRLLSVLTTLAEAYQSTTQSGIENDLPLVVSRALNFLAYHYGEKVTLKEVAENCYCSVTYLSKIFKQHVGCTVYEQLTHYRIINAKRLLREGKTVSEVCYECGFNDSSHFIKVFKTLNGMTPFEYKKD